MSDLDSLRQRLADNRDDRELQRVFADALVEGGDLRGEVLSRIYALADGRLDPAATRRVKRELKAWQSNDRALWLPGAMKVVLRDGLPSSALISGKLLVELGSNEVLAGLPGVERLTVRRLGDFPAGFDDALQTLVDHPCARSLREVALELTEGDHRDVPRVSWPSKLEVGFSASWFSADELSQLSSGGAKRVRVGFDATAPRGQSERPVIGGFWRQLRAATLESLTLERISLRNEADTSTMPELIEGAPSLTELAFRELTFNGAGLGGWRRSDLARRIAALHFHGCRCGRGFLEGLINAGPFASLKSLTLSALSLEQGANWSSLISAISGGGWAPKLAELDLSGARDFSAVSETVTRVAPRLKRLTLPANELSDAARRALRKQAVGCVLEFA